MGETPQNIHKCFRISDLYHIICNILIHFYDFSFDTILAYIRNIWSQSQSCKRIYSVREFQSCNDIRRVRTKTFVTFIPVSNFKKFDRGDTSWTFYCEGYSNKQLIILNLYLYVQCRIFAIRSFCVMKRRPTCNVFSVLWLNSFN